jgi:hypothetical protein
MIKGFFNSKSIAAIAIAFAPVCARAQQIPDRILFMNAAEENISCVIPRVPVVPSYTSCSHFTTIASVAEAAAGTEHVIYLVPFPWFAQGRPIEFVVINRPFLADYTVTIEGVTQVLTGPLIRSLDSAKDLRPPGAAAVGQTPVAKSGVDAISSRSASDILNLLLDESTAAKPEADLTADGLEISRERDRILQELRSFKESYTLLRGIPGAPGSLASAAGSPNLSSARAALESELIAISTGPNWPVTPASTLQKIYSNENEFRNVLTLVQDLAEMVKLLGSALTASTLPQALQTIEADISQYQKNIVTFAGNIESAADAADLLTQMIAVVNPADRAHRTGHEPSSVRTDVRLLQVKTLLAGKLKIGDKPAVDDAEINNLLDKYVQFLKSAEIVSTRRRDSLLTRVGPYRAQTPAPLEFRIELENDRVLMSSDLPQAVAAVNSAQGELIARVNYIYDHSAVPEPAIKQIDLSGHSGNLAVSYTIAKTEAFVRRTVPPAPAPGPATATPVKVGASQHFQVHDYYHATVVGFFTFGYFRDQSFSTQAVSATATLPQACTGMVSGLTCATPVTKNTLLTPNIVVGPLYYLAPTDSYPNAPRTIRQKVGIFGGLSATGLNRYFAGIGYEPSIGVQFLGGIHIGRTSVLDKPYSVNVPAAISGDFPTHDAYRAGIFFGAGFDLNLFRKLFGGLTSLGSGTAQ